MPDEGWVRIYHPDQYPEPPDPDEPEDEEKFATVTAESFHQVWDRRGWLNLDEVRAAVDPEDMPDSAAGRIKWIDSDPDMRVARARAVLEDEESRDSPRSTVVEHAETIVIDHTTSNEDQTTPDNEGSKE
jgi:hypothetical protein